MIYYIDVDVYFCLNFLMDLIAILAVHRWNHCIKKIRYCIGAAFLGALYPIIAVLYLKNKILLWVFTYLIVGQLLVLISMDRYGIKRHLIYVGELYLGMFFLTGIIVIATGVFRGVSMQYGNHNFSGRMDAKFCMLMAVSFYLIFSAIMRRIKYHMKVSRKLTKVKLVMEKQSILLTGLCDSGNLLVEPITGKPVCVMDQKTFCSIKTDDLKPIFIPYHTIDKEHGMMKGFFAERLIVNHYTYYQVPIAVHHGTLSKNNSYGIILPPEIFNERGECDVFEKVRTKNTI